MRKTNVPSSAADRELFLLDRLLIAYGALLLATRCILFFYTIRSIIQYNIMVFIHIQIEQTEIMNKILSVKAITREL